jgi:death-on-curing protein
MPRRRAEPPWLTRLVIDAIHGDQIREHGGLAGVRDENAIESALARARHKWLYDETTDVATLAAAYAFGLIQDHPYRDGNKRVGLIAMVTFLGLNGEELEATESEVLTIILQIAASRVTEADVADWVRHHIMATK